VPGWAPRTRADALLFIHGWTSGHKNAHLTLAQFLNLARLDPHVKPFVFGWPCGSSLLSFPTVAHFANTSTETHEALASFVASLAAAGIRRLHVFAHSMGARLFCNSLPALRRHFIETEDEQKTSEEGGPRTSSDGVDDETPRLTLCTCTLLHPEHDLQSFIQRDYRPLRSMCEVITLYMDRSDQALAWAEFFNRAPSLGKHPFALVAGARPKPPKSVLGRMGKVLLHGLGAARGYQTDEDLQFAPTAQTPALDVDVVDISWMDTNTMGPRHSYFNVNRWLIDDLAEIILTRRRAAARPHRLVKLDMEGRTFGNVWVFLAAPSWIGA